MILKDILGHKKDGTALTKDQSKILSGNPRSYLATANIDSSLQPRVGRF
jgi:hypothetical protein